MERTNSFTEGRILPTLLRFSVTVFGALFLQALYGGVDLLVVGQFAGTGDVSGVVTGSSLVNTLTMIITGLSMGVTILVGEAIGRRKPEQAGQAICNGILLFFFLGLLLTVGLIAGAPTLARWFQAPEKAFLPTVHYIQICGAGGLFIVGYNLLGAIFRGLGDARTPLLAVLIACIMNIAGDLLLVAVFHLGAAGAALATVASQGISVLTAVLLLRRKTLPFPIHREFFHLPWTMISHELRLGLPVALQELFVGTSFMVIQGVANTFGVVSSAGVGIAEKVCAFIMLVPSAYMQSLSAFVAQNRGAGKPERARRALFDSLMTAGAAGLFMFFTLFFHGDVLASLFTREPDVIDAAASYLQSYGVDGFLSPLLFCFIGFFNGCQMTLFVMFQGMLGALFVRIPLALFISQLPGATLFHIGLSTPASSVVQLALCVGMYVWRRKRVE